MSRKVSGFEFKIEEIPCVESEEEQLRRWDQFLDYLAELLVEERLKELAPKTNDHL